METKQFIIYSMSLITLGSDIERICGRVPRNQDIISCIVNKADSGQIYCILVLWESSSQKRYNKTNL